MIKGISAIRKIIFAATIVAGSTAMAEKIKMTAEELLSRIHSANQEEITAAKLAQTKASSPKVQQYADKLEKDHYRADQLVIDLAKKENLTLSTMPAPKSSVETGNNAKHVQSIAKLKSLGRGPDFDKAFIEAMQAGHSDVINMLMNADTSDAKVKSLVAQLLPKLKSHEAMANHLESSVIKEAR